MKSVLKSIVCIILWLYGVTPVGAAEYGTTRESLVAPGVVGELGGIVAHYDSGQLRQEDQIIVRLPEEFFWTKAALGANDTTAEANPQTGADWAAANLVAPDQMRYGCEENCIVVPAFYSSEANGLFNGPAALLNVELLNSRELLISFTGMPDSTRECYFILYSNRVFVPYDFEGEVSVQIDSPSNNALQWPTEKEKLPGEAEPEGTQTEAGGTAGESGGAHPAAEKTVQMELAIDSGEIRVNGELATGFFYIDDDRVYMPVRFLAEKLRADGIQWLPDSGQILIRQDDHIVNLFVGQKQIIIDGQPACIMESPLQISGSGLAMIQVRYLAGALGAEVEWDGAMRRLLICK